MPLTAFIPGDTVRARVTAQKMIAGSIYIVTDVTIISAFGHTAYEIVGRSEEDKPFSIMNGHLLLEKVEAR